MIGSRPRAVRKPNGVSIFLIIRRLRCCECGSVHHELPNRIIPYKRQDAECVARILAESYHPCEISSIRRLRIWFGVLKQAVLESLRLPSEVRHFKELLIMSASQSAKAIENLLKFLVKKAAEAGRWILRKAPRKPSGAKQSI